MTNRFKFKNEVRISGMWAGKPRVQIGCNTLTFAAADFLIQSVLGSGTSRVAWLYLQHGGSANTAGQILPSDLRTTQRSNFVATASSHDNGGLWVPLLAAPSITSTAPGTYQGNAADYFFRVPGSPQATQYTGNFVPGTSLIYSMGLAVSPNLNDRTQDQIISVYSTFTPFLIASGGQEAVDYPLQVTIPAPS